MNKRRLIGSASARRKSVFEVKIDETKLVVATNEFVVIYSHDQPDDFVVEFGTFRQVFFIPAGCDSAASKDLNSQQTRFWYESQADLFQLNFEYHSTLWTKVYHLDVYPDHIEFYYDLVGEHNIDTLRFFEGIFKDEYKEHFYREWLKSNRNEINNIRRIIGLSALLQLTTIPRIYKQMHRTTRCLDALGEAPRRAL